MPEVPCCACGAMVNVVLPAERSPECEACGEYALQRCRGVNLSADARWDDDSGLVIDYDETRHEDCQRFTLDGEDQCQECDDAERLAHPYDY